MPGDLEVCFFVCSGSEANELALRMARTATGAHDVVVLDGAYHGHTGGMVDLSPYKFDRAGGAGRPAHVHVAPVPDTYRGAHRSDDAEAGSRYAEAVAGEIRRAVLDGRTVAAFFAESIPGCAGQIVLPDGYLEAAYGHAREAGAVCVADEVQVGFGRVGSHWWAFETQGATPDIVTLGKPIGNGHPMAAVVTTRAIAEAFDNGMEYFNTFGGNPVSCAVGLAVLDVIEDEGLRAQALDVGTRFREGLAELALRHELVGDVRGLGLFIGVELVRDRESREPAAEEAADVINLMRERRILLSTDGPFENVIKIKPPLVFTHEDAGRVVSELDAVLAGVPSRGA
jgi:4-aminobutyrate aminotransferase-like enzyme